MPDREPRRARIAAGWRSLAERRQRRQVRAHDWRRVKVIGGGFVCAVCGVTSPHRIGMRHGGLVCPGAPR